MIEKQNDPILKEKKVNISPTNYSELNKLSEHFGKHFVPQKELPAEQAFWLPISNPISKQLVVPPTPLKIEVPSELSKASLVKTSFQKLKNHLAKFDKVLKERTTPSAITEGTWSFEHTKEVFITQVIPFLNSLRESFKDFDNGLHNELNEVKTGFNQMEAVVEQCFVDKKCLEIKKKELFLENDRLLELIISQDLVYTAVNYLEVIDECESMRKSWCEEYNRNLTLKAELSKMNELSKTCSRLQNHCISLVLILQQYKESFQNNRSYSNLDAPALNEFFVINDLKAQLQAKESPISKLRAHIATLKGKNVSDRINQLNEYVVLDKKLDTPYPMEVDTPYSAIDQNSVLAK
ncbi:hypothetical protein Tco_0206403 [Tanacetum coccineum]